MKKNNLYITLILLVVSLCFNCTDEIPLETQDFEDVLVVEATLTNELKFQEVKLSRTYLLESTTQKIENNANVLVNDTMGNSYSFAQNAAGIYVSDLEFEAMPNIEYQLLITTSGGKKYNSLKIELTPISQIDNLYAEFIQEGNASNKVQVLVDSNNETTDAQYFRYEYVETHKVIVPQYQYVNIKLINIVNDGKEYFWEFIPKTENEEICFTTNKSNNIIQTSTKVLDNNIVSRFPIRTIDIDDSLLRERYSIIVKQYVQSIEAYNYYKAIHDLSADESLLSESQPGYILGNVSAVDINSEKVIGFFEVASVSSTRLYFNYLDVNIPRPPYPYDCLWRSDEEGIANLNENHLKLNYSLAGGPGIPNQRAVLYNLLKDEGYYKYNGGNGYFSIVHPVCGDCTSYSSNIQPDFWED